MTAAIVGFWAVAVVLLAASLAVVLLPNLFHSVLFLAVALVATGVIFLFLGAWLGPGPAWLGPVWFLLKAMLVFLVVTWVRWSFVRIRVDQILAVSWKLLLPATLLLLLATAFLVVLRGGAGA